MNPHRRARILDKVDAHRTSQRAIIEAIFNVTPIVGKATAHIMIHAQTWPQRPIAFPASHALKGVRLLPRQVRHGPESSLSTPRYNASEVVVGMILQPMPSRYSWDEVVDLHSPAAPHTLAWRTPHHVFFFSSCLGRKEVPKNGQGLASFLPQFPRLRCLSISQPYAIMFTVFLVRGALDVDAAEM